MSKLTTLSVFYFGHTVTTQNRSIDFDEGGAELQATLKVGDYTLTEYAAEIKRVMDIAGTQIYTTSINRSTRAISVSAPSNFTLRVATGSRIGTTAYTMAGFTGANRTGSNSYTGNLGSGSEYRPQYPVFNYTSTAHSLVKETASVNISAVGVTQLIYFGEGSRPEMNIRLITNQTGLKNAPFFANVNGVANALTFMSYLITKAKVEFMPDVDNRNLFDKLILESTRDSKNGTEFTLLNMKTPEFYETGDLTFRKVIA
jgi:hypothetical protein